MNNAVKGTFSGTAVMLLVLYGINAILRWSSLATIESDGVSPVQIFGLDRETMVGLLKGLATNYPEFISVTFTLDLDNINLRQDKTAADILDLF